MKANVIVDTGVLVAYLNRREQFYQWAKTELAKIKMPLLTCEAVIVESCFLLNNVYLRSQNPIPRKRNRYTRRTFSRHARTIDDR
jgi:predicted nucleic acid-binding protein